MNLVRAIRDAFRPAPAPRLHDPETDALLVALRRQRRKADRQRHIIESRYDWNELYPPKDGKQ